MGYYSFNRPRRDGRLSWPCWLTDCGRFTHTCVQNCQNLCSKCAPRARTQALRRRRHRLIAASMIDWSNCAHSLTRRVLSFDNFWQNDEFWWWVWEGQKVAISNSAPKLPVHQSENFEWRISYFFYRKSSTDRKNRFLSLKFRVLKKVFRQEGNFPKSYKLRGNCSLPPLPQRHWEGVVIMI